jgi:hypothetical protein
MLYRRPWWAQCPPGRRLVRGGRCDRHDRFNRERVVRDRRCAAFEACEASDSPKPARMAGVARADRHRWGRPPTGKGDPCNRVRPLPSIVQASLRPRVSQPSPVAFPELGRSHWPRQARPGIRASCERRGSKGSPLLPWAPRSQAHASMSRAARGRARSETPVTEPSTSRLRRSRASPWRRLAASLEPEARAWPPASPRDSPTPFASMRPFQACAKRSVERCDPIMRLHG